MKPTVGEIMDTETHAVSLELPLYDAIDLLVETGETGNPELSSTGQVLGVLSEEHCLKLVAEGDADFDTPHGTVRDYFDPKVPQVSSDMDIYYVAGMFLRDLKHRRFPVVDDDQLVGVVTRKDVLRAVRDLLR